jgi:hypothetical protein
MCQEWVAWIFDHPIYRPMTTDVHTSLASTLFLGGRGGADEAGSPTLNTQVVAKGRDNYKQRCTSLSCRSQFQLNTSGVREFNLMFPVFHTEIRNCTVEGGKPITTLAFFYISETIKFLFLWARFYCQKTALSLSLLVFRVVTAMSCRQMPTSRRIILPPSSGLKWCQSFGGMYCFNLQPKRWRQHVSPKLWHLPKPPHSVTTQNTSAIFIDVSTTDLTQNCLCLETWCLTCAFHEVYLPCVPDNVMQLIRQIKCLDFEENCYFSS